MNQTGVSVVMIDALRTTFPGSGNTNFVTNLVNLTRSKKDRSKTEFCTELREHKIQALDFDEVKESICALRLPPGEKHLFYCSVDALLMTRDGLFCFVEFKNSTKRGLDEIDDDTREGLKKSLWKKAFDSLSLAGMVVTPNGVAGRELMGRAILCVVYRNSLQSAFNACNIPSAYGFDADLSRKHASSSISEEKFDTWDLDKLKEYGLYKDVRVDTEGDFVNWAKKNLTKQITGLG